MTRKYIADYVLQQHGYTVIKDTYTICYITRYISVLYNIHFMYCTTFVIYHKARGI